jgi:hypothetical protein
VMGDCLALQCTVVFTQITKAVAVEFGIKALAAEAEDFCGRCPVIGSMVQRCFDAESLNQIGTFADDFFERNTANQFGQLFDGARQFAADNGQIGQAPTDVANAKPKSGLARIDDGDRRHLDLILRIICTAHYGRKIADRPMVAQLGHEQIEINPLTSQEATKRLPP